MAKESLERPSTQTETGAESPKKKTEPVDTLYSRPFDKEKHGEQVVKLEQIKENEQKVEKMKERFTDLVLLFSEGRLDTPVDVSGEKHWLELENFSVGEKKEKPEKLIRDVSGGLNPASININLKLIKTEGREESLYLNLHVSAGRLLAGGGALREDLKKNITDIFGGTDGHYRKITEMEKTKENKEENNHPVGEIEKNTMLKALKNTGAEVSFVGKGEVFTLIAEYPSGGEKIMVSLYGNREPWHLETISARESKNNFFSGSPGEVLSEIYKYMEK